MNTASFASDVLDGYLARRLGQTSALGAQLDSVGDFIIYITLPLGAWWLWPDIARREALYCLIVLVSCVAPPLVALGKFAALTSYHTWGAKLAALEEIAITLVLPERRMNVRSFWHGRRGPRHEAGTPAQRAGDA